jgi:hypothetical protein
MCRIKENKKLLDNIFYLNFYLITKQILIENLNKKTLIKMEDEMNDKIEKLRRNLEVIDDKDISVKEKEEELAKMLDDLNEMLKGVAQAGKFSPNEEFKEIKTEDIKYLLIPYYQAEIIQKFMEKREVKLELTLKFYAEFYKILDSYNYLTKDRKEIYKKLTKKYDEEEDNNDSDKKSFDSTANERDEKIKNYKYKKALSDKLKVKNKFFI